jgi:sirohydrochlorin ferrochelatase
MKDGIVLLGHGSKLKSANERLSELAKALRVRGGWDLVEPAFLQLEGCRADNNNSLFPL